jgi:hypothetical protein
MSYEYSSHIVVVYGTKERRVSRKIIALFFLFSWYVSVFTTQ